MSRPKAAKLALTRSEPVALVFADAHLNNGPDSHYALKQLVAAAIRHKVTHVTVCGDSIDKTVNPSIAVIPWYEAMTQLQTAGIRFTYVDGNHGKATPPWLSAHPNAIHLHRSIVPASANVVFYGLDCLSEEDFQAELTQIPDCVTHLIGHQTCGDWMGTVVACQFTFADIPSPITTAIFGDLHKPIDQVFTGKDGQQISAHSPGATWQMARNEPTEHSYLLVHADGSVTRHLLNSRPVINAPVMQRPEDLDQFVTRVEQLLNDAEAQGIVRQLPQEIRTPKLYYTFHHALSDAVRRVEKVVAGRAILAPKELPPADKAYPALGEDYEPTIDEAVTPLSELAAEVDREQDPEVFALTQTLLAAPDPKQAFAAWRINYLKEA